MLNPIVAERFVSIDTDFARSFKKCANAEDANIALSAHMKIAAEGQWRRKFEYLAQVFEIHLLTGGSGSNEGRDEYLAEYWSVLDHILARPGL
jgi:hypothetical protein